MPKTVKVHVTFDETKRIISYQKGAEVQELRAVFLQVFSDVLSSDIAPAHVKFQLYDDQFKDHVELSNTKTLEEDIKIRALVTKEARQAVTKYSCSEAALQIHHHYWPHWRPWYDPCTDMAIIGPGAPIFQRPHVIKKDTRYRLWNPVSRQNDSFIERDPKTDIVTCSGSFNSGINTVMTAIDQSASRTFFVALQFRDNTKRTDYVLTGNGEDQDVTAVEYGRGPIDAKSIFEPLYYWSYTMFRNKSFRDLYLGCDHTGKTTLLENTDLDYPNPQILFVLNKFESTVPI